MKDNQINQAIAEACGWTDVHFSLAATDEFPTERRVVGIPPKHCTHDVAPNYCSDLNAMHEAEKTLKGYEQIHTYVWHLNNRQDWETDFKLMEVHISARDRAKAFLLTLGKWSATNKDSLTVGALPPETQITVNGKTFFLADIDKEMTE